MGRAEKRQLERKTGLKKNHKKGMAFNSTLRPGPWNRHGKISQQVRKHISGDHLRSLWIRTLNASWNFTTRSPSGFFPKGKEGLRWGLCMAVGCNKPAAHGDHVWGRGGSRSPSPTDPRGLGALCEYHNNYVKGSEKWGDYRPKKLVVLIEKLAVIHFEEDPLKPGKFQMNHIGRAWIRDMYGSL